MSEQNEPIFMEPEEYLEYIKNQVHNNPELASTPVAQLNVYQMNKDLVRGLTKMNNMAINNALEKVADWFDPEETHYALINHEHHYFTIFESPLNKLRSDNRRDSFIREVKDILVNYYGDHDIRAIDVHDGAIEIWAIWDGEPTVGYLFPYTKGVVEF